MAEAWNLGIVGVGHMGSALIRGVVESELLPPTAIHLLDIDAGKTAALAAETGARIAESTRDLLVQADTIILATRPQDIEPEVEAISAHANPSHLFISIAAGIPCRLLARHLGREARLIRVMPNTPSMIGCGAAGICRGGAATDDDLLRAKSIFDSVGRTVVVEERLMNAVTGLSGSGPAYVYRFMEALAKAGEAAGLPADVAAQLSRQTVLGAVRMVAETGEDPGDLRRAVAVPGGTTEAGLKVMEEGGIADLMREVIARATARGEELGKDLG